MSFWTNYATKSDNSDPKSRFGSLSRIDAQQRTPEPAVIAPPRRKKRSASQPRTTQMYDCPTSKVTELGYDRDAFTFNYINGLIKEPLKRHMSSDISLFKSIHFNSPTIRGSTLYSLPNTPQHQYAISTQTASDYCPFDYPQPAVTFPISPPPYDDETEVKRIFASEERLDLMMPRKPLRKQQSLEQREMLEKMRSAHVYQIIKQRVDEKFFGKTRSMDSIFVPIRTLSNEHLFQTIVSQQQQIHSLNEQQQFIQRVILSQQQQLRDSNPKLHHHSHHHHSHHRSRSSLPEAEAGGAESKRSSSRERIREQISKQQKQVAEHIKQLHEQLNALMERRKLKDKEINNEAASSLPSGNDTQDSISHSPSPSRTRHNASSEQSSPKFTKRSTSSPNFDRKQITTSPKFDRKMMDNNYRSRFGRRGSSSESPPMSSSEYGEEEKWKSEEEIDYSNQTVIHQPFHGRKGTFQGSKASIGNSIAQQEDELIEKLRREEAQEQRRLRDLEMQTLCEEERLRSVEFERHRQEEELRHNEEEMIRQQNLFIDQQNRLLEQQKLLEKQNQELRMQTQIIKKENEMLTGNQPGPGSSARGGDFLSVPYERRNTSGAFMMPGFNPDQFHKVPPPRPAPPQLPPQQYHSQPETDEESKQFLSVPNVRRNTNEAFANIPIVRPKIEKPKRKQHIPTPGLTQTPKVLPTVVTPHEILEHRSNFHQNIPSVPTPPVYTSKLVSQLYPQPIGNKTNLYSPSQNLNRPAKPARRKSLASSSNHELNEIRSREPTPIPSFLSRSVAATQMATNQREPSPFRDFNYSTSTPEPIQTRKRSQSIFAPLINIFSKSDKNQKKSSEYTRSREPSPFNPYSPQMSVASDYSSVFDSPISPLTPERNWSFNTFTGTSFVPPKPERSLNVTREHSPARDLFTTTTTTTEVTLDQTYAINRSRESSPFTQIFPQQSQLSPTSPAIVTRSRESSPFTQNFPQQSQLSTNQLTPTSPTTMNRSREPSPFSSPFQHQHSQVIGNQIQPSLPTALSRSREPSPGQQLLSQQNMQQNLNQQPPGSLNLLAPTTHSALSHSREPSPKPQLPTRTANQMQAQSPPVKPERSSTHNANNLNQQNMNFLSPMSAKKERDVSPKPDTLTPPEIAPRQLTPNRSFLAPPTIDAPIVVGDDSEAAAPPPPPLRRGASPMRVGSFRKRTDLFEDHFDQYVSPKATKPLPKKRLTSPSSKSSNDDSGIHFTANPISHSNSAEYIVTDIGPEDINLKSEFGMSMSALNESNLLSESTLRERRQTLPDVSTIKNAEEQKVKTNLSPIAEKTVKEKRKKSMFAESTTPPPPPDGWEREKVAAMAHEMRETRMKEAMNTRLISFQKITEWTFSHRLIIVVVLINCYLAFYFYQLFKAVPNAMENDDAVDE